MRGHYIPKIAVPVSVALRRGVIMRGDAFVLATDRVLDMLNGPAAFFPLRLDDGGIRLVAKREVNWVSPLRD
ncbi:MAG: hypothetical protein TEF_12610 [Rhizobiales bacterium NRL2]|nr:MAG: hypothetical protein TEF_12610 [Rhizobiales bacterium NRL2]